eukprot:GFUD01037939.1.p1 GENE.GFUD01037939.1~~GFUD01037939.1.p1  ORF type:complete len:459 (-),score=101.22 GFUD01037939.1:357-1733(-)
MKFLICSMTLSLLFLIVGGEKGTCTNGVEETVWRQAVDEKLEELKVLLEKHTARTDELSCCCQNDTSTTAPTTPHTTTTTPTSTTTPTASSSPTTTTKSTVNGSWCSWKSLGELRTGNWNKKNTWSGKCNFEGKDNKLHKEFDDQEFYDGSYRSVRLCECPSPSGGGRFCTGPDIRETGDCCEHHRSDTEDFDVVMEWKSFDGAEKGLSCPSLRRTKRQADTRHEDKEDIQEVIKRIEIKSKTDMNKSSLHESFHSKKGGNTSEGLIKTKLQKAFDNGKQIFEGNKEVSMKHLCRLHQIITDQETKTNPGQIRNNTVAMNVNNDIIQFPPASKLDSLLEDFIEWLNTENSTHPIIKAVSAHFKLVNIHPFRNGNGRTARLLMNLLLTRAGYAPVFLPREARAEYSSLLAEYMGMRDPDLMAEPTLQEMLPFIYFIVESLETSINGSIGSQDYGDMHQD